MRRFKEGGFTLIELMVTIVMMMLALAAGYTYFYGSQRASTHRSMSAEMEDNARMAMDVVARSVRATGFLVDFKSTTYSAISDGTNSASSKIVHINSTTGPDQIMTVASNPKQIGSVNVDALKGSTSIEIKLEGGSTIKNGDILGIGYLTTGVVESVAINDDIASVTLMASTFLRVDTPGPKAGPPSTPGTPVFLLSSLPLFKIENDLSSGKPVLYMGTQPLAENIEDLQIEYGVDRNGDDTISADEWSYDPATTDYDMIRLAKITIIARTDREIKGYEKQIPHIDAADHVWDKEASDYKDGYMRFMLQRVVKLRNLSAGGSL